MAITHREQRSQSVKIHFSDPTSTRTWIIWGSRDRDEILAHLTMFNIPPVVDTVAGISRYLQSANLDEAGNGVWKYKADYAKDPSHTTVEVNYTGGTQKMLNSLELVRSYSCDSVTGAAAGSAITEASEKLNALDGATQLDTSIPDAISKSDAAQAAALSPGVDPSVLSPTMDAAIATSTAVGYARTVKDAATAVYAALSNAINAAQIQNVTAAASAAASAASIASNSASATLNASSSANDAHVDADNATAAADITGAPEDYTAQLAAQAAAAAATTVANDAGTYNDLIQDAATAAQNVSDAVAADAAGGIPAFGTMINVTDRGVDGTEVEDRKCDITVSKHFVASTMTAGYLETLESMSPSVNDAEFAINYKGQVRVYKAGELKFKNFSYKQDGDDNIDITFYLAFSPNITSADNIKVGNSPAIEKDGWDYISVFYVDDTDKPAACRSKKPRAVFIHRVYRRMDFSRLQLGI